MLIHLLVLLAIIVKGQAKLVINGGIISINNGAALVIDNPDNTAISRIGAGYIISEAANNRIVWSIGPGNGNTYLFPFGNTSAYLPLSFSAASGSPGGQVIFSTYKTSTWKNSDNLPPGVTNVNSGVNDNSAKLIDRFWQINPQGYSNKPTLTNLIFTYSDLEYALPNTIIEGSLIAQRWNNSSLNWGDYIPSSTINTANNTVTIASIPGNQLFDWWTLTDASSTLPVTLVSFDAVLQNKKVLTSWQTAFESNTSHFEVWRAQNPQQFNMVGAVPAAGNSTNLLNYSLTDHNPYTGISWYRLKTVDLDGRFEWSVTVRVENNDETYASLYPNPATATISFVVSSTIAGKKPTAYMYDSKGSLLRSFTISDTYQSLDISSLSQGVYHIHFTYNDKPQTLSFIKK